MNPAALILPVLMLLCGCALTPEEKAHRIADDPYFFTAAVAGTSAAFAANQCWFWEAEREIVAGKREGDLPGAVAILAAIYDEVELGKAWRVMPMTVTLPELDTSPVIDGEISGGEWEYALVLDSEFSLNATVANPSSSVCWRFAATGSALCFAVEVRDEDVVSESGRWGDATLMYEGDCIEFFVRPDRRTDIYFEFIVNPNGELWSLKHQVNPKGWWYKLRRDYDSGAVAAVQRTPTGYTVELMLPFDIFGPLWNPRDFSMLPVRIDRTLAGTRRSAPVPFLYDGHNLPCHIRVDGTAESR